MRTILLIIVLWVLASLAAGGDPALGHRGEPTRAQWMCIHKYEAPPWSGGWRANTGNGYYGGLQMNAQFERNYGRRALRRWGHAYNWPVHTQIGVATRGWRVQGWGAWPNTSRKCGYR